MDNEPIAYMRHLRSMGFCARGGRDWAAAHGINWGEFLKNGIPVSVLRSFNDAFANALADKAVKDQQNGR